MTKTATTDVTQDGTPAKGDRTRAQILEAATRLFAEKGYDGTGIRDIESAAGVKRGVVTYHFGNKEEIWKAMFAYTFTPYIEAIRVKVDLLRALDARTRARFLIEDFVRTSAARPYMNRLMIQENFSETWRSEWIARHYLIPFRELSRAIAKGDPFLNLLERDPHVRYVILGACNAVFSHRCEVRSLFDKDVTDADFVDAHVAAVLELFDTYMERLAPTPEN